LPSSIRAIVPTQRGHGDSERPACCYRPEDLAADAVALLDALGIERADVVGHSMGSFIAQRIAVDHADRVNRLVLIGSGTTVRTPAALEFNEVVQSLTDPVALEFVREFQASTMAIPVPQTFMDGVVNESAKLPARVWRDVLGGLVAPETRFDAERIRSNTLIVWGAKDAFWPRSEQDGLVAAIQNARLIVYPEAGHAPHWEQPDEFVTDLNAFLNIKVAGTPAQARVAARPQGAAESASGNSVRLTRTKLNTGVELEVAESGEENGEPVLFLHGFPDSWFSYSLVMEQLPAGIRAIAPSQRGFGDSERPACCYRTTDLAADAVALLDALGIARATVVGHSMGSFVAQRIAIDHPERVKHLVLIGSGSTPRTPPVLEFNAVVQTLSDPIAPEFVRDFQVSTVTVPVPPAFMDAIVKESEKLTAHVWRAALGELVSPDVKYEAGRIRAPTLILWGDKDGLFDRAEQDALLRTIPDARLITYSGFGHSPNWEQPDRIAADIASFLNERTAQAPNADVPPRGGS
jgi:pimeloyl-ACP methyl ester carboxylesterase